MNDSLDRLASALSDRYTIEKELGAGGMATVYLAEDLKHHRKVAVKVLRPELAAILGAERFLKEIEVTASLQHPHILPLHDSGEADSFLYYVMPYVEGESLRDKLNRDKQLGVDETVKIAEGVAAALDYAHRQGVIHRDIKPENILLHDGQPVVADFGIALAVTAAGGTRLTETGLSLGTPQYMSPEQATGEREVTGKSDVYSLGAVVYEMLVGDPPHTGNTVQAIIARVVSAEPQPISDVRHAVPVNVQAACYKALAKVPADRFARATEFAEALTNPAFTFSSPTGVAAASLHPRLWKRFALASGVLTAAMAISLLVVLIGRNTSPEASRSWNIALPDSAPLAFVGEASLGVGQPALDITPDGSHIVYVGRAGSTTRLFVRETEGFTIRSLPGTDGAFAPFFSPDGQWIGFFAGDQLKRVSVSGDQVLAIAEVDDALGGTWSDDDRIAVAVRDATELVIVRSSGGPTTSFKPAAPVNHPQWLPGSQWLLVSCVPGLVCAVSPETEELRYLVARGEATTTFDAELVLRGWHPRFLRSGHLIFAKPGEDVVHGVRFDPATLHVRGDPVSVLRGVRREAFHRALQLAVSATGDLVHATGSNALVGRFVWVDGSGHEEPLPFPPQVYRAFSLSPDGRRVAVPVMRPSGATELWLLDLDRGTHRVWAGDLTPVVSGVWDPSSRFFYQSFVDDRARVLRIDAEAASGGDTIYEGEPPGVWVHSIVPDGRLLVHWVVPRMFSLLSEEEFAKFGSGGRSDPPRTIPQPGAQIFGSVSPDGRWLTYTSTASGPYEIYAVRYPVEGSPVKISTEGGELPTWSPRGDGLYYRDGRRWYWVALTGSDEDPFADPELFVEGNYLNVAGPEHAVSPDGSRLLLLRGPSDETTTTLNVVTNWFARLDTLTGNR